MYKNNRVLTVLGICLVSIGAVLFLSALPGLTATPAGPPATTESALPVVTGPGSTPTPERLRQANRAVSRPPKPEPTPEPKPERETTPTSRTVRFSPVTAIGSQATVDKGKLVTWMTSPTCLLAGHDFMGWDWIDTIETDTVVKVTTGPCAGTYKIVGHKWQSQKGGPVPAWMSNYDLIFQTCTGKSGMGFSLAERV